MRNANVKSLTVEYRAEKILDIILNNSPDAKNDIQVMNLNELELESISSMPEEIATIYWNV